MIPQSCKSCGAAIGWIKSLKGRSIPVDAKPLSVVLPTGEVVKAYQSHFATCPTAAAHRKPKVKRAPRRGLGRGMEAAATAPLSGGIKIDGGERV